MSNREIELQRQLDTSQAQAQRLHEVVVAFVWICESMETAPIAARCRLETAYAQAREVLRDTEPQP